MSNTALNSKYAYGSMIVGEAITTIAVWFATFGFSRAVPRTSISPIVLASGLAGLAFTLQHLFVHFAVQLASAIFVLYLELLAGPALYVVWATGAANNACTEDGGEQEKRHEQGADATDWRVALGCTGLLAFTVQCLSAHLALHLPSVAFVMYTQFIVVPVAFVQWENYVTGCGALEAGSGAGSAGTAAREKVHQRPKRRVASKSPAPSKKR